MSQAQEKYTTQTDKKQKKQSGSKRLGTGSNTIGSGQSKGTGGMPNKKPGRTGHPSQKAGIRQEIVSDIY